MFRRDVQLSRESLVSKCHCFRLWPFRRETAGPKGIPAGDVANARASVGPEECTTSLNGGPSRCILNWLECLWIDRAASVRDISAETRKAREKPS